MRKVEVPALLFAKEGSVASVLTIGSGGGWRLPNGVTFHLPAGNVYPRRKNLPEYGKLVRISQYNGQVGMYFEGYGEKTSGG